MRSYDERAMNVLPDKFQILRELGRGGTSVVYEAFDQEVGSEVAVKLLLSTEEAERFRLEATRLESLNHPNVVSLLSYGQHDDRDFIVMECLPEGDLNHRTQGLNLADTLEFFLQICDGLSYLHDLGIVHRDLKPSNILFDVHGRPKIADLGLSRQVDERMQLTQSGAIVGSYSYMSPEQILSSKVGPSADLYSLGVCLFRALTGVRPFEFQNDFAMLKAHLQDTPPCLRQYLPDAPKGLVQLVADLLAKDEQDRPATADDVADRLLEVLDLVRAGENDISEQELEKGFEALDDRERSLMLIVAHLAEEANFENICAISAYAEDTTDRILEDLLLTGFLRVEPSDHFRLKLSTRFVRAYLTPRIEKLYEGRLARYRSRFKTRAMSRSVEAVWLPESTLDEFDLDGLGDALSRRAS